MKPSPLQLNYVIYPQLSYQASIEIDVENEPPAIPVTVEIEILYREDENHAASLKLSQPNDDHQFHYGFEIEAFSGFSFDIASARAIYPVESLPVFIAVNVARMLFSGARELIATVTSRGPYGPVKLSSMLIEPGDVKIRYESKELEVFIPKFFGEGVRIPKKNV